MARKMTIAPNLTALERNNWNPPAKWLRDDNGSTADNPAWDECTRELRALKAVAKAARAVTRPPAPCPPITPEWSVLFDALRRLDKVEG